MGLTTYDITPDNMLHPDTVAVYPITFGGNIENTYDRMAKTAELAGHTILLAELTGQDGLDIDGLQPRDALTYNKLRRTSHYQSEEIALRVGDYSIRLGVGHSLGGVMISSMEAVSAEDFGKDGDERLFNGINLTDSINLRSRSADAMSLATQSPITGYAGYLAYLAKDALLQSIPFTRYDADIPELYDPQEHGRSLPGPGFIKNIGNIGPLMRSPASRETALSISRMLDLPAYIVGLEHGLSGPRDRVHSFHVSMGIERQKVITKHRAKIDKVPVADQERVIVPGRHSRLMDPQFVAEQLVKTRNMVVEYQNQRRAA